MLGREQFLVRNRHLSDPLKGLSSVQGAGARPITPSEEELRINPFSRGLEYVFPGMSRDQVLQRIVDRSAPPRKRIPMPTRGWTGARTTSPPAPKERRMDDEYSRPYSQVDQHNSREEAEGEISYHRTLPRAQTVSYMERRGLANLHTPASMGPKKVNPMLNPGLSRQTPDWFQSRRSLILQDSDRAMKVYMNPEPPVTSMDDPLDIDIDNLPAADRRKSVGTRGKTSTSRRIATTRNSGRWSADPWDEDQPFTIATSPQRLARTQSGRLIQLSSDSCELGFAFSSQSLPTLRRDGYWSTIGRKMDLMQAKQNDPAVLTHGERDQHGLSLGRQSAECQGLMPAANYEWKKREKVQELRLSWQASRGHLKNFLPPTTHF